LLGCHDSGHANPDFAFDPETRFLHITPLSHGSMMGFLTTLFAGGATLTLNVVDLERWCQTVEAERVSHSFLVPTALYRLLEIQRKTPRDFTTLRTIIYGAAPMSPQRLGDLVGCFGQIFVQAYAATEVAQFVAVLGKADHDPSSPACLARLHAAGQVTPGVEMLVCGDDGIEVATGEVGELHIRCRSTISGYYNNPEATAAEFHDGFWRSGDLGCIDAEGYLFIVDRKKDMIITGGFNVYAVEVEAALASHPAILMCAVVGIPHDEWGEAIHAEVILRDGASATAEEIIAHVRAGLGGYKVPKSVDIVTALPLSAVGKVLRRIVRDKYWSNRDRSVG
jgi:acyl-CoA synthetase (AMP-forming)/AMP-acid ligase II